MVYRCRVWRRGHCSNTRASQKPRMHSYKPHRNRPLTPSGTAGLSHLCTLLRSTCPTHRSARRSMVSCSHQLNWHRKSPGCLTLSWTQLRWQGEWRLCHCIQFGWNHSHQFGKWVGLWFGPMRNRFSPRTDLTNWAVPGRTVTPQMVARNLCYLTGCCQGYQAKLCNHIYLQV